jgi:hypothetical protein
VAKVVYNVNQTRRSAIRIPPSYASLLHSTLYMADWERDVRSLLRPSEHLLVILEGSSLRHDRLPLDPHPKAPPTSFDDTNVTSSGPFEELRVVLAIVGHDDRALGESGRLTYPYIFSSAISR